MVTYVNAILTPKGYCITIKNKEKIMSKKMFALVSGIIGGLQTIGVAIVTYTSPEYATAINSAIVIAGAAAIEICNLFVKAE